MHLFQDESDDTHSSLGQYDNYMKVTSLRVWLVLCAIIFFLIGVCLWIKVATLETTIQVEASIQNQVLRTQITLDQTKSIRKGMEIRCGEQTAILDTVEEKGHTSYAKALIDIEDYADITCTIVVEHIPVYSFFTGEGGST